MSSFNTFESVPSIPYEIVKKLATSNNEDLWKALYYNDYDCLSKEPLTFKEKINLIWKNEDEEQDFRIFLKPLVVTETIENMTQLRINKINIKPDNVYVATILYQFMIITGYRIAMIDVKGVPTPRIDFIEQQLLKELNGKELGLHGVTTLQYNRELDREMQSRLNISNSKSFFGISLILGLQVSNLEENCCGC